MKKTILFIMSIALLAINLITLTGCSEDSYIDDAYSELMEVNNNFTDITEKIEIITPENGVIITMSSSDVTIIDNDGKVTLKGNTVKEVIILFTFSYKDETVIKAVTAHVNPINKNMTDEEYLSSVIETINIEESTIKNIDLPTEKDGVVITWTSNNNAINNQGVVTRGDEDIEVTLKATFSYNGLTDEKEYQITVLAANEANDKKYLQNVIESISFENTVTENIELPTEKDEVVITWASNNTAINNQGVVTRGDEDIEVTLKATFSYNGLTDEKEYQITVLAAEIIFTINDFETWLKGLIPSKLDKNINLPHEHQIYGGDIIWESSNENFLTDEGVITKGKEEENVSLKAQISYNGETKEVVFTIIIASLDLEARYNEVIDSLSSTLYLDGTTIAGNISLPTSSIYDSEIEWISSNESVISNDGKVSPAENDTVVTLSYIILLDDTIYEDNQSITVTVKGNSSTTLEPYYQSVSGLTGLNLKNALHDIIDNNKKLSYGSLWTHIAVSDRDPNNSSNVILLYTGASTSASNHGGNSSNWNREHVWPQSRGKFDTSNGPGTDLHHLRPTWVGINGTRGNLDYDEGGTKVSSDYAAGSSFCYIVNGKSFEPRDEVKGDVARMLFYMATRYDGGGDLDLELNDKVNSGPGYMGRLSVLLKWNIEDPVDAFERNRNEQIYKIQGNRNPFIDHPEFVAKIWGTSSNFVLIKSDNDMTSDITMVSYAVILENIKEKNFSL